jgi:hypothetical protein
MSVGLRFASRPFAVVALALAACTAKEAGRQPAGGGAAQAAPLVPGAATSSAAVRQHVPADAEAVCAAVAAWWRRDASVTVRVADSLVAPPSGDTAVAGCVVVAHQEHGLKRDSGAAPDTAAQRLGAAVTLVRATGGGWIELVRYMADGPDGSSGAFQRTSVRCAVAQSWDGGDDSDPSYVPADWHEEQTICWAAPEGIAVSDTAP